MFRGINPVSLDPKGRINIPSRYREELHQHCQGEMVITIDTQEYCLLLYPLPEWQVIQQKIESLPSLNPLVRRIQRLLIGHATDVLLDNNGRLLLPPALRDYARLEKKVVLVGQGKKFELWDEQTWTDCRAGWLAKDVISAANLPDDLQQLSL